MMMCKTKIISSLKESKAAFFYSYGTENLLFFDATLSSFPSFTGSVLMANDFQGCLIYNLAEKEKKKLSLNETRVEQLKPGFTFTRNPKRTSFGRNTRLELTYLELF